MLLSTAIALGQGTVGEWKSGSLKHCALGMACNSVGLQRAFGVMEDEEDSNYELIREAWPWLSMPIPYPWRERANGAPIISEAIEVIYDTFDREVMDGTVSFEKFLDWIRIIEPAEAPEPTFAEGLNRLNNALDALHVAAKEPVND